MIELKGPSVVSSVSSKSASSASSQSDQDEAPEEASSNSELEDEQQVDEHTSVWDSSDEEIEPKIYGESPRALEPMAPRVLHKSKEELKQSIPVLGKSCVNCKKHALTTSPPPKVAAPLTVGNNATMSPEKPFEEKLEDLMSDEEEEDKLLSKVTNEELLDFSESDTVAKHFMNAYAKETDS